MSMNNEKKAKSKMSGLLGQRKQDIRFMAEK